MKKLTAAALPLLFALTATAGAAQEPNFSRAVALDGADLIVGQPVNWYGPGVVYTYAPGSNGDWVEAGRITAPDSTRMDDFGRSLSLNGDMLAVGAPRKRDGAGVVYTFSRAGSGADWVFAGTAEPAGNSDHAEFGAALVLSGDDLFVGSPEVDGTGVVYRFARSGPSWSLAETIRPGDDVTSFGSALSYHQGQLLIGAPGADEGAGRVYASAWNGSAWSQPSATSAPDGLSGRPGFGTAVLLTGSQALVGAPGVGQLFVLEEGAGGGWAVEQALSPTEAVAGSRFGFSMDVADGELWVGAPGVNRADGRVYRFAQNDAGGWGNGVRLDPDQTEGNSWPLGFGYSVAVSGDRAIAGMPTRDFGEGRAMTFDRSNGDWQVGQMLEGQIFRVGDALASGDRCEEGVMSEFPCANMELVAHIPNADLGGERGAWLNDVWGWTDPDTDRRYVLVARRDGASFVEVTNAAAPRLIGTLARTEGSRPSVWRDIKVIGTHAFIVADGAGAHGMQVFDLTRLRDVTGEPVEFEPEITYDEIHSAHNVVADTESGYVYVVGSNSGGQTCGGGLHMVDVRDPVNPVFAGCYRDEGSAGSRGYTHDAQCLVYRGPDEDYVGRQICLGSNESELNIADVTNKSNPETISRASYPNVAYAHQGWLDDEQRYFYMNDEGDETAGLAERTRTMVWDLIDLDDPILVNEYFGPVRASDHNLFVTGNRMYQANYGSGLRVLDISDRANPVEVASFDSAPYNDNGPGFSSTESGAWSNYPFFGDGLVIFTSVREGLFIVRVTPPIT